MEYPLVMERAGVVTSRLNSAEVELWPLPRRLPLNVARI